MDIPPANDASNWLAADPFAPWEINFILSRVRFNQLESSCRRRHLHHLSEVSPRNPPDREHSA